MRWQANNHHQEWQFCCHIQAVASRRGGSRLSHFGYRVANSKRFCE